MSVWTSHKRVAHPEWLESALKDMDGFRRVHKLPHFPKVLEYPMLTTHIKRLTRVVWPNGYVTAWVFFCAALAHTREHVIGILYRFWRYRILMKSQERDLREMMSYECSGCKVLSPFTAIGEDRWACDSCGHQVDFDGLCEMKAGDDDD